MTFSIAAVVGGLSSSSVVTRWLYIWPFTQPQRKKDQRGVRSGEDRRHATSPSFPVRRPGKFTFKYSWII
jgi:hypothetical protein